MAVTSLEALISLLLSCACDALAADGRPACGCAVRHAIQWPSMAKCDCKCAGGGQGQAWARLQRVDPFNSAPAADNTSCGATVTAVIDVGVHRCVAAFDGDSPDAPDDGVYTADALHLIRDEFTIRKAVSCCPRPDSGALRGWSWTAGQSLPLGPMGGCAGFVVSVVATGTPRLF